jgi:hypothetical protein
VRLWVFPASRRIVPEGLSGVVGHTSTFITTPEFLIGERVNAIDRQKYFADWAFQQLVGTSLQLSRFGVHLGDVRWTDYHCRFLVAANVT